MARGVGAGLIELLGNVTPSRTGRPTPPGKPSTALGVHDGAGLPKPVKAEVEAPTTVGHHSTPKEILKKLPEATRNHPDVRGRPGNPNVRQVDPDKHKKAHDKTGISPKETGIYGGAYNKRFQDEILDAGGYDDVTPEQLNQIREKVMGEFGL